LLTYGDFLSFQDVGRRHLGISKFGLFNSQEGQGDQRASRCQISRRSVKSLVRYGDNSIFQNGGRHHHGFLKFENLTVVRVKRFKLRHRFKFSGDRSNGL